MSSNASDTARRGALCTAVLLGLLLAVGAVAGDGSTAAAPTRVELRDRQADLDLLNHLGIDIEGVHDGWARVYIVPKEADRLASLGFALSSLPDEGRIGLDRMAREGVASGTGWLDVPALYHTYETLTADLQSIAGTYPNITRLTSIGQSVNGRELWIMKITDSPNVEEDEPAVAYLSSMHGDEVVGKELTFNLIDYLTSNYGTDPRVTSLVDSTEIWILPSLNPDGTAAGQRTNANGVDLNRNFPDWYADPINTPDGRELETAAVMAWQEANNIDLSSNYHGGALVMNYPFDNNPTGSSVFSPTPIPDHPMFYSLSRTYADNNLPMYNNNSSGFDHGVTNGAAWYSISGGLQDYSYTWHGNFHILIEVSYSDWPPASTLPQYWAENQESMLAYFERVHEGIRGIVTDAETGAPLAATIHVDANPFPVYTDPEVGDYHRLMLPGPHGIKVSAPGYVLQNLPVTAAAPAARYDVALAPLPTELRPVSTVADDGPGGDGWLDAGEAADLVVELENVGRGATGIITSLVPTGWYADVVRPDASYPDIPTGASDVCTPPCYRIQVDPSVPTAHEIGFAIEWSSDQGSGTAEPFYLAAGGPFCQSAAATDVPQQILDNQLAKSYITVTEALTIDDVRVTVDISHTYIGDLIVSLSSPSGTRVDLHDSSGGSANDIRGTYGVDLTPAEPLSVFAGELSAGTWRLDVFDQASGDTGTLNAWSLELCEQTPVPPTPEIRLRDLARDPGGVLIRWWPYPGLDSYRVYRTTDASTASALLDVTVEDTDDTDAAFLDASPDPLVFWLVTGIGDQGEGPLGHFGQ